MLLLILLNLLVLPLSPAKGDGIAVSPNIRQEGAGNASMAETNKLLRAALSRPAPTVNLDSIEIGTVAGLSAFPIQ